jgi:hypothetical protein
VRIKSLELVKRISLNSNRQEDFDHSLQEYIEEKLLFRSQNTFLWLGFALAELMRENSTNGALSAVNHLPQGLHEVYEQMLRQIKPHQREVSLQILGWVALARHPMSLEELASAVNCQPSHDW